MVGNDSASAASPGEIVIWADANNENVFPPANLVFINENSSGTLTENRTIVSDATGFRFGPQSVGLTDPAVVTFADGPVNSLYVASSGRVGLGTSAPSKKLDVHTTTIFDGIQLTNDLGSGNATSWNFAVDGFAGMTIQDAQTNNGVMRLRKGAPSESLVISADGQVGLGTASPAAPLEIAPSSGNAAFRLNFGGATTWAISNTGSIVTFNQLGSGGQEATFRQRMDASGFTFEVQGSVAATAHVNTSSRALKTAFEAIDPAEVLAKVSQLPVTAWQYKEGPPDRHIGPVAEDFQDVFGLGDGKHISTVDAQGVTFAAIQGLNQKLEAENTELERRVAELEAVVQKLMEERSE